MLDGLKSKLGFKSSREEEYEEYYDDEEYAGDYDEFAEYADGVYDAGADDFSDAGRHSSSRRSSASSQVSSPRLVSIDDVRASTQISDSLKRDPLPRHASSTSSASSYGSGSSTYRRSSFGPARSVERASDYLRSTETSDLPVQTQTRSEGLDSLFSSTTGSAAASASSAASSKGSAYDPYEAYSGAGSATHSPSRAVSVIKPSQYSEVERVAKTVKAGDAVVLALGNTPDALAKRVLDFSFGVASALDASVECVADKVFVVARGAALTDAERMSLRAQGVL